MTHARTAWALWGAGLAISLVMASRAQVGADQLELLARGWTWAARDVLIPYGNLAAVGFKPGPMTSWLVGAPLQIWMDPRAPVVLILASHVVAYLLIDRVVARECGPDGRLLLVVFYWLNPWRLFFSGFLWDPNYMFLAGAVLLWTCHRQRTQPSFLASLLAVATVGAALQLQLAAVSLVFSGALLAWRGYWRPHWLGVGVGAMGVGLSLVPWLVAVAADPSLRPGQRGHLGLGAVLVYPVLRGVVYWLRYGSLYGSSKWMTDFDFEPALGETADGFLSPLYWTLAWIVGPATLVLPLAAHHFAWRRWRAPDPGSSGWLLGYVKWVAVGTLVAYGLAQTTVMMWMGFAVQHAAVLPLVVGGCALLQSDRRRATSRASVAYAALALLLAAGMSVASATYRRGGDDALEIVVPGDHAMLRDLSLDACCSVRIDPTEGRWPPGVPDLEQPPPLHGAPPPPL